MPITPVTLYLDVEQGKVPKSGTTFGLTMKQGEIPYVADSALQINRSITAQSVAGRVTFNNVIPSDDLIALGFTDARYTIESAAIGLSVDFLVPRLADPDFSGGDLSVLMALSVPEGEGSAPIGTVRGWSPLIANIADGARVVQRVVDWSGGLGQKPATGLYLGATGLVASIADATDVRGVQGIAGPTGPAGAGGGVSSYNDLTDKPTLGNSAARDVGTASNQVSAGNHTHTSLNNGDATATLDVSGNLKVPYLGSMGGPDGQWRIHNSGNGDVDFYSNSFAAANLSLRDNGAQTYLARVGDHPTEAKRGHVYDVKQPFSNDPYTGANVQVATWSVFGVEKAGIDKDGNYLRQGIKILGAQQPAQADSTNPEILALQNVLRAHGLMDS